MNISQILNIPSIGYRFRQCVCLCLIFALTFNPFLINYAVAAAPQTETVAHIDPDGNTETTTDRAQNGTPLVNIARPSAGGVSHNTFRDYNVLSDNAILNNFKGDVGTSQLGGALYGNPNFNKEGGRTANVILNEITSNRITRLEGYTEIFGDKAALIIANPNGIQTSGAGFINTSRLSLITGKPNLNQVDGTIDDFDINPNSQILITARNVNGKDANGNDIVIPLGLDASTTNYSEIISRTVKISGAVYGGENFNIKTGNHKYDYNTKEVTSNSDNSDSKPEISIDSTSFGGMYAGRISFVSTEDGVGVKTADGNLQANIDDITFTANGDVEFKNNNIKSKGKLSVNNRSEISGTNNKILIEDVLIEEGDFNITSNQIENKANSVLLNKNGGNINLNADIIKNNDNAYILSENDITLDILGGNDYDIEDRIVAGNFLYINANNITNNLNLLLSQNINITAQNRFTNNADKKVNAINDIIINSKETYNYAQIASGNDVTMNASSTIANENGASIFAKNNVNLNANDSIENNKSQIWADNNIILTTNTANIPENLRADKIKNISGKIGTKNGDITINSLTFTNKADLSLVTNITHPNEYHFINGADGNNIQVLGGSDWILHLNNDNPLYANPVYDDGYAISFHAGRGGAVTRRVAIRYESNLKDEDRALVKSGNNITINAKTVNNVVSNISAKEKITINAEKLNNVSYYLSELVGYVSYYIGRHDGVSARHLGGSHSTPALGSNIPGTNGYFIRNYDVVESKITAKDIDIDSNAVNNSSFASNLVVVNGRITQKALGDEGYFDDGGSLTPDDGYLTGLATFATADVPSTVNVDTTKDLPIGFQLSTNNDYLFESAKSFQNQDSFLGSDYFLKRLGFDPQTDIDIKRLGDAAYEQKLLMDAINNVTNYGYLEDDISSDKEQEQRLYDNAFDEYLDNPQWEIGTALTNEQVKNLKKDIVWLVKENVKGEEVLVTKIYLASKTIKRLTDKKKLRKGSIIEAENDLTINADSNINSNLGSLIAGNDLSLNSKNGDINLINTILNSSNNTNIVAKNKVNIANDVTAPNTLVRVVLSNIASDGMEAQGITKNGGIVGGGVSGGNLITATSVTNDTAKTTAVATSSGLTFNAGTDLNISGANVTIANNESQAGGSVFITATGGDINNSNYQISADQNIVLSATNDINNIHSGNDNLNPTSITAGNVLSATAGNNITNRGATMSGANLVYLSAGGDINNEALINRTIDGQVATAQEVANSNADRITSTLINKGTIESASGNVVLVAANDVNNTASNITSGGETFLEATGGNVNINTDTLRQRTVNRWHSKKNRGMSISDSTTNVASTITSGGNLNIISGADTNILGSDVNVTGDLNNDATGNLNIKAVQDTNYTFTANHKRGSFGRRSATSRTTSTSTNREANVTVSENVNTDVQKDISVVAANLTSTAGNINLTAKGKVNVLSGQDTSETSNTSKKHGVTTIAKSKKIHKTTKQITSDLTASNGAISLRSGDNTLIVASNLTSGNDTNITVGSYIDGANNETINNAATLNILNAMDSEYDLEESSKLGMDAGAIAVGIAAGAVTGGIVGAVAGAYVGSQAQQGNIDMVETYDETIKASKITSGNNINIEVASDALIRSSDLSAKSGNVNIRVGSIADKNSVIQTTNSNANLNITAAEEKHIRKESHEKIKPDLVAVAGAAALSGALVTSGSILLAAGGAGVMYGTQDNVLTNRSLDESSLEETKQISSNIISKNDLNAISANNINIVASNFTSNDANVNLTSGGETNILSATESSTLTTRQEDQNFSDFTGGIDRGRVSVGVNMDITKESNSKTTLTAKSSNINANNVTINSNNDVTIQASNMTANNNVNVTSTVGNVNVISAQNNSTSSKVKEDISATLSAGVGHVFVDTAYAIDDASKAAEAVDAARDNLRYMKKLRNDGRATDEAVRDSEINLTAAILNAELAIAQAAASVLNSYDTAPTLGFYANLMLSGSNTKSTTNTTHITNTASNITSNNGNVTLTANSSTPSGYTNKDTLTGGQGNITQKGSKINANNGDISYTASNDVDIAASKDTYDYSNNTDTENLSIMLASSRPTDMVITNVAGSLGYQKSQQKTNSITYNNSTTNAQNININSGNDANITGANILATNDLTVTVGNDLNIKSLQNELHSKGDSKGLNLGGGTGKSGNNASFGFNRSKNKKDRVWTDEQTTLLAQNSVTINTTKNTDIKGAVIANKKADGTDGGNLTINTNSLTYEDLTDKETSSNNGFGVEIAYGINEDYKPNESGKKLLKGLNLDDTKVSFNSSGYEKEQITKATIGNGTIKIAGIDTNTNPLLVSNLNRDINTSQVLTKDTINGNLDSEVSIQGLILGAKTIYNIPAAARAVNPFKVANYKAFAEAGENEFVIDSKTKKPLEIKGKKVRNEYYDPLSHEKAAEAYGQYVRNETIGMAVRSAGEYLVQYPVFIATYNQNADAKGQKGQRLYDPLGIYSPSKDGKPPQGYGTKGSMSGKGYFLDSIGDIKNVGNGAIGNYTHIENIDTYNSKLEQFIQNNKDNK